jgi:DNA-binding response OmpR family regulator
MRMLLAEDDPRLGEMLARGLREASYAVDWAQDGNRALYLAAVNEYDAAVLDVMMPGRDGLDVCRAITARDTVLDKITGLDAGGDDYLTKPFDLGELLARLRALMRRAPRLLPSTITVADLTVDTRAQRAERGGRPLPLTPKEYALLEFLARNAGRVVSRADLTAHVWDDNHDPLSNAIEVNINRLRKKVDAGGAPLIHTRRGAGYQLAPPEAESGDEGTDDA